MGENNLWFKRFYDITEDIFINWKCFKQIKINELCNDDADSGKQKRICIMNIKDIVLEQTSFQISPCI